MDLTNGIHEESQPRGTELALRNIIRGAKEHIGDEKIPMGGKPCTRDDLVAEAEAALARYERVHALRRELASAIEDRDAFEPKAKGVVERIGFAVVSHYGPGVVATGLGFKERKRPRALTSAEQELRTQRYRATWALRHPFGSVQKARKIKGVPDNPGASSA